MTIWDQKGAGLNLLHLNLLDALESATCPTRQTVACRPVCRQVQSRRPRLVSAGTVNVRRLNCSQRRPRRSRSYTTTVEDDTLLVRTSGFDESLAEVQGYGMAIISACIQHGVTRVLCNELHLEYRLGT